MGDKVCWDDDSVENIWYCHALGGFVSVHYSIGGGEITIKSYGDNEEALRSIDWDD